jgi:serine protease Do
MNRRSSHITGIAAWVLASVLLFDVLLANENVYQQTVRSAAFIVNLAEGATGSGVLIDREKGQLLTNYHVVKDAAEVAVLFPHYNDSHLVAERDFYANKADDLAITGRVTARDPSRDLALIELERVPADCQPITFACKNAKPGQQIHSIGNPGASDALWVYTAGQVRAVYHRELEFAGNLTLDADVVETSSPINPGDSGGPVVNDEGQLVALIQSHGANDMSVCIDVSELRRFLSGGPKKKSDSRVQRSLDQQDLKYEIDKDGDFRLVFEMEDGCNQVAYVTSQTMELGPFELRQVWAPIGEIEGSLDAETASLLLQIAAQCKLGNCQLVGEPGNQRVVFCATVPADLGGSCLDATVRAVVDSAHTISEIWSAETSGSHAASHN